MSLINALKGARRGVQNVRAHRAARPLAVENVDVQHYGSGHMYCKDCGTIAAPATDTPGSILIELVLWLCFIIPGLIYSLWRHSRRHDVCAKCGSAHLIPPDSPLAGSR